MPRVQSYGQQKVTPAPLPNQRKDTSQAVPTAETFGAARGRGMAAFGSALSNAGEQGLAIANRIAFETDKYAGIEAHNRLTEGASSLLNDPQNGVLNVKGKAALDAPKYVREKFDKLASDIETSLKTPRQKQDFANTRSQIWTDTKVRVERHAAAQFEEWTQTETAKGIENAANSAIADAGDPRMVAQQRDLGVSMVLAQAQSMGWGPQATADAVLKFNTVVHHGVITQLLVSGKDRAAQVYYEETKDQISGSAHAKIEAALESGTTEGNGLRTATALWDRLGPKSDTDPIALDAMEDAARQQYADDPKSLKATMAFLRERKAAVDASRADRAEALAGGLWKAVANGTSLGQLRTMPEYLNAPGKLQASVRDYIVSQAEHAENRAYTKAAHAAADASRRYTEEQRADQTRERNGLYMYYQYAKPENLTKMSDDQVWQLAPTIGLGNVQRLFEQRQHVKADPAALDDFRSDTAVIDGVLVAAKIDPTPNDDDKVGRANIGWFKEQVAAEQRRVQSITKKKVDNEELKAIAKRILGQQVIDSGTWYWPFDSSKPLMTTAIGDVPKADYQAIKASFAKNGVASPTDDQILGVWRDAMTRKK